MVILEKMQRAQLACAWYSESSK